MIHWLQKPHSAELAKYIDCYWFLEKLSDAKSNDYPKLNPDPSAHLILALPKQAFKYSDDHDTTQLKGSHWLQQHGKTFELDHSQAFACIGIKFHVGALYSLPKLSTLRGEEIFTAVDDIIAIDPHQINVDEGELLTLARIAPEQCSKLLDNLCLPWCSSTNEDKHSEIVRRILPLLSETTIHDLAAKLFCSQRTLERSFLKVTGLTLKQCQSMNRLEEILEYLYQRELSDIDWVDIAYQFGFSDQPHLIRYLKKQIGVTPQGYAKQRGFTIDVYGGVAET